MATTQQVTHFDLKPDFDVLVRPAHGGELIYTPDGWAHYAWHVLVMCRDENLSLTYRTGTGITKIDDTTYQPTVPPAIDVVRSMAHDLEDGAVGDLADFLTEFGYDDVRRGVAAWQQLASFRSDMLRVFPLHLQHFIDTYRED